VDEAPFAAHYSPPFTGHRRLVLVPKARFFWPLSFLLLFTDCGTKQLAVEELGIEHVPREVLGDALRFTLTYNPNAAFSFSLGEHSRIIFSVLATVVILVLWHMYTKAESHDRGLGAALGLITGGALGNLTDRLRSPRGVMDFIDMGLGDYRFWTFNVADVGVTAGAALLLFILLRRSRLDEAEPT
jgi:signal peptidase II